MKEWICKEVPIARRDGATVGIGLQRTEELVRCKNCKFGTNEKNGKGEDVIECSMSLEHICHSLDYYCADGEMK